ncbi:unnamed protein product [Blepharisma stoltei]|uniref:Uncharacterized protein n=1 Tax=Blepharisma stoltei TaxID=1481888 RepID=A0AAU9KF82_9CILI|nr:unnamed protein product [Blepharisma stoltei]
MPKLLIFTIILKISLSKNFTCHNNIMKAWTMFLWTISLVACKDFTTKNGSLDPGRITWPKEDWYNNPIDLSQTNAGTLVTLTFNFRPTTTLKGGIVQIIFPSTFPSIINPVNANLGSSEIQAGTDMSVTTTATLPSNPGFVGPFGIITRSSQTGQITDANFVFGCIAISEPDIPDNNLSVYSVSQAKQIGSSDSFVFHFPINKSIWKNDIIEIIPPKDWSPSSNPTCSSSNGVLVGPSGSSSLPCAVATKSSGLTGLTTTSSSESSKNSVYIYGVAYDAYITTKTDIAFTVSEFYLPSYVVSTSSSKNSWEVKLWRFGTNNLIRHATGSGTFSMTPGTPRILSWLPRSTIPNTEIMQGMTIFTDLTIVTENNIPASGTLSVTFYGVDIYYPSWWKELDGTKAANGLCYLSPYINGTSCSVDTTQKVTIKFDNYQTPKTFTITVLTNFNSDSPQISKIESKTEDLYVIDSLSSSYDFELTISNILLSDCTFHGGNSLTYEGANKLTAGHIQGGELGKKLYFRVKPGGEYTWGDTAGVTIVFNINYSTSPSFTKVYIDSKATTSETIGALTSSTTIPEGNAIYSPYFGTQSSGIYVSIPASSSKKVSPTNYYLFAYSSTSTTSLPSVASNVATFYEMWAKVEYSSETLREIGSNVFSVMPLVSSSKLYSVPLCTAAVFGIPIVNYIEPISMSLDFDDPSYSLYIDIDIESGYDSSDGFLHTGIMTGEMDSSKFASDAPGARAIVSYYKLIDSDGATKNHAVITLMSLGKLTYNPTSGNTIVKTYLPQHFTATGTYNTKTMIYYTVPDDPKTKMELYESSSTWSIVSPTSTFTAATSSGIFTVGEAATLTISPTIASGSIANTDIIGVGMTKGTTQQEPVMSLLISSNTYTSTNPYSGSSVTDTTEGAFVMTYGFSGYSGTSISSSTTFTLKITNVYPPNQVDKTSGKVETNYSVWIADGSSPGNGCKWTKTITSSDSSVSISTGKINSPTCSMTTSSGSGLVDVTLELSFTISHDIPAGGLIEVTMGTSFGWSDTDGISACSSTTLTPSDGSSISCKVSASGSMLLTSFNPVSSGTSISIFVKHVLPSSSSNLVCFTLVTTQASAGKYIDSYSGSVPVVVDGGSSSIGIPTYLTTEVYPNNAGMLADLYMAFSMSRTIPAKGKIVISQGIASSWNYPLGTIQDFCWSNVPYLACKIENFNVVLTLSQDLVAESIVEIYIDSAFVLPKVPGKTSSGIKVQGNWAGTVLVKDSTSGALLDIGQKIDSTIQISSIAITDIANVGESATYKFTFGSVDVEADDFIVIQFPRSDTGSGFDPYIGDATNPFSVLMPDQYELKCSSSALGTISCSPNHWYLTVTDISTLVTAETNIDVSVYNVRNPYMVTDGKFSIWHYNSTGYAKAFGSSIQYTQTVNPSKSKVMLKSMDTDDDAQSTMADYTFEFYPTNTSDIFTSDTVFYINFPEQFNYNMWKSNSIACSSALCQNTTDAYNCDKSWNPNQLCSVNGSKVMLSIQSDNSIRLTEASRIVLTIPNIQNPGSGLKREKGSGWDTMDTSTFGSFNFWSSKFEVGVWNTVKLTLSKSYGLLNSGYKGYTQEASSLGVDYSEPSGRIALIPGQQSDDIHMKISNSWPSVDKSIKFIPTISGTGSSYLKLSSQFHGWVLKQMHSEIVFRVAALRETPNGIYYIDWTLNENSQDPNVSMYNAPSSTLIEVHTNPDKHLSINISKIPKLYVGYSSVPVCVTMTYAPANNLMVTPTFNSDSIGIAANPAWLQFAPDINSLCFTIDVAQNYASSNSTTTMSLALSGDNSNIYKAPASIILSVGQLSSSLMQANLQLQSTVKDGSTVSISVASDYDVILYWSLTCKGADILPFKTMVDNAPVLTDPNSYTLSDQLADEYANKETDIDTSKDKDIYEFFSRQHAEHCDDYYISSQVVYAKTTTIINLDFLMGGTDYTFAAYGDHKLLSDHSYDQPKVINFTTSPLQPIMTLFVTCTSTGDLSLYSSKVASTLAKYSGINPSWLYYISTSQPSNRRVQAYGTATTFSYYVIYDRSFPGYSSSKILENFNKNQANAMSELKSTLYLSSAPSYTFSDVIPSTNPAWELLPVLIKQKDDMQRFNLTSSINGKAYVSCGINSTNDNPAAWQVMDGLDARNNKGRVSSIDVTAHVPQLLSISGLQEGTTYYCYLTLCNNYPMWPTCMEYGGDSQYTSMSRISVKGSDSDGSVWILLGLSILLIFN